MQSNRSKAPARRRTEKFFVQVAGPDNTVSFFNVTEKLGQPMPFEKPKATCAMRATDESISFSLLHLTKRSATNISGAVLEMPRGPLAKLERKSHGLGELTAGQLVVEHDGVVHQLSISRDENGLGSVEMAGEAEDPSFELPKGAVQLYLYLASPAVGRTMGVMFIGHLGKPGDTSTLVRAVSMVLFSLTQLVDFRILSGIETVNVPAAPSRWAGRAPARRTQDTASVSIPVRLYTGDVQPQPLGEGEVVVTVDLENANPSSGRLLFHYTPSEGLAENFLAFRPIIDSTIASLVTTNLGADDVANITYEIVLGVVEASTISRLKEALDSVGGLDCTPTQYRQHTAVV